MSNFKSLAYQFDPSREEIVERFFSRIESNKRCKLSKQELEELIDIFITNLQSLQDSQDIFSLCKDELKLLEKGYPVASVAKNYLPKYRKAIENAIEEKRLKLNQNNSRQYVYCKGGTEYTTREHLALTYFKYDRSDYEEIARSTSKHNNLKQDSLQPINYKRYLERICLLLDSDDPLMMAISLAALTGRRFSEIVAYGKFQPTKHPYRVEFSGQLKKRSSVDNYQIFTLIPASKVLDAFGRFRAHPRIASLQGASIEEINKKLNTPINRLIKHHLQDSSIVPILATEAGVTIQNLRGIYGEIAIYLFCPTEMGVHRFLQEYLGHISKRQSNFSRNSSSTEHYFHYYLVDEGGQPLTSKGILVRQFDISDKISRNRSEKISCLEQEKNQTTQVNDELFDFINNCTQKIENLISQLALDPDRLSSIEDIIESSEKTQLIDFTSASGDDPENLYLAVSNLNRMVIEIVDNLSNTLRSKETEL